MSESSSSAPGSISQLKRAPMAFMELDEKVRASKDWNDFSAQVAQRLVGKML